ncbi:hypothetical protein N7534_004581 [Penicillium rubens]|nr:hypothetical protein N7534_004581 [Penicillium rubens]
MADTSSAEAQGLHDLCLSAFTAEYKHDHQSAASLHGSSVEHLTQALQRTGRFEHNKKRVLRRKIKIHEGRLRNLNIQHAAPFVLVVPQNRQDMIEEQLQRGAAKIGLEDMALGKLNRDRVQDPKAKIEPFFQYLVRPPLPFYTPTVDLAVPNLRFDITGDAENSPFKISHWCSTKVKLTGSEENLYICDGLKRRKRQIPGVTISRVSEYPQPYITTRVGPARWNFSGRTLEHTTSYGNVIKEKSDRSTEWAPRRFTFGGRRFVWKPDPATGHDAEYLVEVRSERPKAGSRTGKIEDEVFETKLAWTNGYRFFKGTQVEVVGGLDPFFREFLFASQSSTDIGNENISSKNTNRYLKASGDVQIDIGIRDSHHFKVKADRQLFSLSATAQNMLWLVLFAIPGVRGQCSQECGPISSLLSSCSLPGLDTDWHEFQHLPIERNLSGLEYAPFGNGPETARIATYDEARCFCTKATNSLSDCEVCARSACSGSCYSGPESETPTANQNKVAGYYHRDCKAFGYFANSTLSSPSTTLSSMPPTTEAPDYNSDCEICGVIHGQITECGLVDLDTTPPPTQTSVLAEGYDYHGSVLLNRTAAECFYDVSPSETTTYGKSSICIGPNAMI